MLSPQNRMTRSIDFGETVRHGNRVVQPDLVIHLRRTSDSTAPKVGLIIAKSVGSAVQRHRVARRLRHVARGIVGDLDRCEQLVIRALPSSRDAVWADLERQLRTGLSRIHRSRGSVR
ncbi:ribonuclease P protein component [Mycobacterium sp.]|uniref:ribonuclease P protein component n=1 Tax=Mycobacterium sp. TaxID=1785 RepID=UPI0031E35216